MNELHKRCPGVSLDMIRKVLKDMALEKSVECLGRGKQAKWRRIGYWVMVIGNLIGKTDP